MNPQYASSLTLLVDNPTKSPEPVSFSNVARFYVIMVVDINYQYKFCGSKSAGRVTHISESLVPDCITEGSRSQTWVGRADRQLNDQRLTSTHWELRVLMTNVTAGLAMALINNQLLISTNVNLLSIYWPTCHPFPRYTASWCVTRQKCICTPLRHMAPKMWLKIALSTVYKKACVLVLLIGVNNIHKHDISM